MLLVADNLHVLNASVVRAIEALDPEPIRKLIAGCLSAGAQAIDINPGPLPRAAEQRLAFLVETVQSVTDLPLLLDTTNPAALEAGLKICRGRPIINGFSLQPAKLERILPLATRYDADIIGYLLDADSRVPGRAEEMMSTAVALLEAAAASGLDPRRLIIDPVVAPLSWDSGIGHNQAVLSVVGSLRELLGVPVRTIAGLSNLASGPAPREKKIFMEQTYLPMLAAAGLDMLLLDVLHAPSVRTAKACDALLGARIFSWAEIAL